MRNRSIMITASDMDRLMRLVQAFQCSLFRDQRQLELLDQKLASADVRSLRRVPRDLIRMNSCIRIFEFDTQRSRQCTLVYPEDANVSKRLISVLAPLGIALLGQRTGDVVEAQVPGGIRRLRVERVWQQSAANRAKPFEKDSTARIDHLRRDETSPAL